ncbi:MAG: hypothetical protein ACYCXR_00865 [Coriobacteriia bacterium]
MPQMAFVQGMALAALIATLLVVLAIPVGARVSARSGMIVLRTSLIGVVAALAALAAWGASTGDLARFNARMGAGTWLQMGAFFGIIYVTGYRFVASYLADKNAQPALTPGDGESETPMGGTDA